MVNDRNSQKNNSKNNLLENHSNFHCCDLDWIIRCYYNQYSFKYIDYELNNLNNRTILLNKKQFDKIKQFLFNNKKNNIKVEIINDNKDNNNIV